MNLIIENLCYSYQPQKNILKDLFFSIDHGEKVALMGSSGSGKSTLLKLVNSYLKPISGSIRIDGQEVIINKPFHSISYVSQSSIKALFPWLTLIDNLHYPLKLRCQLTRSNREFCDLLIEKFKLTDKLKSYPHKLSGGEQKRLSLAVALSYKPGLVLLDEPFSGIDFSLTEALWSLLYEHFKTYQTTVLIATHSVDEAIVMADRVVYFDKNKGITPSKDRLDNYDNSCDIDRCGLLLKKPMLLYKEVIINECKDLMNKEL